MLLSGFMVLFLVVGCIAWAIYCWIVPPPDENRPFLCAGCCGLDRAEFYRTIYRAPDGELRCGKCGRQFHLKRVRGHTDLLLHEFKPGKEK